MDFGYAASPLVLDGRVIAPVGGEGASVVALDYRTGDLLWKSGDQPGSYVGAIPVPLDGKLHVVVFLQNSLAAFDAATGRLQWQHVFSQGYDEHAAAPIYREPHLMIASPFKSGAQIYELSRADPAQDSFNATWVLDIPKLSNDTASSLLIGNHVFGFDLKEVQAKRRRPSRGSLRCFAWPTGEEKWSDDSTGHVSMIAADEKLVMFNDLGELIIAEANSDEYRELGRTQVFEGEICWTAPALHRNRLFLRTPTRAACVYIGDPKVLRANQRDAAIPATLVPQPNAIGLYWLVGGERTYPFDTHSFTELWNWFVAGICCFAFSLVSAAVFQCVASRVADVNSNLPTAIAFWLLLIATGITATPLLNSIRQEFYFTWPAVLFASFQLTLQASVWADKQTNRKRSRWISRSAGIAFLVTCACYFTLCRKLSHSSEWIFLAGFLPAAIVAIPTAYSLQIWKPIRNITCLCLGFSVYFWSSASINMWLLWNSVRSNQ